MSLNPRFTTRPIPVSRELTAPASHLSQAVSYTPEQRLRAAVAVCDDPETIIHVFRFLREAAAQYGDEGKVALRLIDIIEEVVK